MTRIRNMTVAAMTIICGLSIGCQNTIHVRVQKVVGDPFRPLGGRVSKSNSNLVALVGSSEDASVRLENIIDSFEGDDRNWVKIQLQPLINELDITIRKAEKFQDDCQECLAGDHDHSHKDPHGTLKSIREFSRAQRKGLRDILNDIKREIEGATSSDLPDGAKNLVTKAKKALRGMVQRLEWTEKQSGFGGFKTTDTYSINPSDEEWGKILMHQSPIVHVIRAPFWQYNSLETITSAKVSVSGDSAIMLVMEHPGQVRVYQVSMNPTQITRNIGLLISKATAATAKYMSGGLAP